MFQPYEVIIIIIFIIITMPTDNSHKFWETPSDKTSVSSASKSDFLASSIVIPGQCNFSCSRGERMMASPRRLKTEIFGQGSTPLQKTGMFGGPEVSYQQTYSARDWLFILRTPYPTQNLQRKYRSVGASSCNSGDGTDQRVQSLMFMMMMMIMMIIYLS